MAEILLDITPFEEKISLHSYLKEELGISVLLRGESGRAVRRADQHRKACADYARVYRPPHHGARAVYPRMVEVFKAAAQDNYHITLTLKEA